MFYFVQENSFLAKFECVSEKMYISYHKTIGFVSKIITITISHLYVTQICRINSKLLIAHERYSWEFELKACQALTKSENVSGLYSNNTSISIQSQSQQNLCDRQRAIEHIVWV